MSPATRRPPSPCATCARRYDLPVLGVVRPGAAAAALATRNRRVGVIATPATVRSHAYFNAIKDENPAVEVYEHATPRFVPMVEAGILPAPSVEAVVARGAGAAARRARRGWRVRLPAARRRPRSTRCCWAAPTTRCSRPRSGPPSATESPSSTRRRRRRPRSRSCSRSTASRRPARPAARPRIPDGPATPTGRGELQPAVHVQLTTGDVAAFRPIASRMFGEPASRTSRRSSCGGAGRMTPDCPRAARRPAVAGRLPRRIGPRRRRDRARPAGRALGPPPASSTGPGSRRSPSAGCARRPAASSAAELRRSPRPPTQRRWPGRARACRRHLGTELPGVVDRVGGRRPRRLGPGEHGELRRPDRPARGQAPRPGAAARRRARPRPR